MFDFSKSILNYPQSTWKVAYLMKKTLSFLCSKNSKLATVKFYQNILKEGEKSVLDWK